jgi:hypothetical protein
MGGANPNSSQQLAPLNVGSGVSNNPVGIEATRPWEIQSPHAEKIAEGIAQGVSNFAMGMAALKAGQQKPDATAQAASAGKVGPVADMSDTAGAGAAKQYMKDPRLANFLEVQYPTAFKYQQY